MTVKKGIRDLGKSYKRTDESSKKPNATNLVHPIMRENFIVNDGKNHDAIREGDTLHFSSGQSPHTEMKLGKLRSCST
jgi:hypothetical protein